MNRKLAGVAAVMYMFAGGVAIGGNAAQAQPASDKLDYSNVYNNVYSYPDLVDAKVHGLSDTQIAKLVKIAKWSGKTFAHVLDREMAGLTIGAVAEECNVPMSSLRNVRKERDEVAAYESAYLTMGSAGMRRNTIDKVLAAPTK